MKSIIFLSLVVLGILLSGCSNNSSQLVQQPLPTLQAHVNSLNIVTGQVIFVPAYSEIFFGTSDQVLPLTTTLAIHNTDPDHSIIIKSVRYYDTDGALVKDYVDQPVELKAMATTGFVVASSDTSAGWGANFMVEWGAESPVYEPVVEAVMVSSRGTEGVSFISEGRVVSEQSP